MEKDCKLQLCHIKAGPVPLSGKLRLVDEFNRATTFGVLPWNFSSLLGMAQWGLRLAYVPTLVHKADALISLAVTGVQSPSLPHIVYAALALELMQMGTSKFTRAGTISPKFCKTVDEIDITREQHDIIHHELSKKTKFYSVFFNNCFQQTRREFNQYKERFKTEAPSPSP